MDDMDMDVDMDVDGNENEVMNMRVASQIQEVLQRLEENMTNTFPKDIEDFYDTALRLCLIFGDDVVIDGLSIAENGLVRIVRDEEGRFPQVYEVRTGSFCTYSYYIYDSINYCKCRHFTNQVAWRKKSPTVSLKLLQNVQNL